MTKSNQEKEDDYYSKSFNAIWNQYLFIGNSRESYAHRFEILLVLTGIFLAVYSQLEFYKEHVLNYAPFFIGFIILLLSLCRIIPRKIWVPWVSIEDFNKYTKSEEVYKQLIEECFEYIPEIRAVQKREKFYLKLIMLSLLFSLLFPIIPTIYVREYSIFIDHISISIIASVVLVVVMVIFYKKFDAFLTDKKIPD